MNKLKKFKVYYSFDGNGEVEIEAKDEDEAREMFFEGEFKNEKEGGETYDFIKAEETEELSRSEKFFRDKNNGSM